MMHLCIVATLCFFKIISPRNYHYCDQDDFPWVYGSKYVSKSNCCQRLFVFYILDVKNPKLYKKIRKFYENDGVEFSGDPLDDYDILIDCIAEDLASVEVA